MDTHHVCERMANRSAGDTAVRNLDSGRDYPRDGIVQKNIHPLPAKEIRQVGEIGTGQKQGTGRALVGPNNVVCWKEME